MSAIDIVLVVIALVAVGVAVAYALQLKGLRAELRERGDSGAEMLAALEQANNALDTLNVALAETRRTANAIAQQQTTDAAVEQQRYLTIAREFSQAGDRMDDLRRETAQQLGANREGIEHRLDKVRETVDAQLGAIRKDNNVQLDQMRATVDEKLSRTLNDRLSASFKQVNDQLEAAKAAAFELGVSRGIDPFMTLSFMALPVIPTLRITTRGVFDVTTQRYI